MTLTVLLIAGIWVVALWPALVDLRPAVREYFASAPEPEREDRP